MLGTRYLEKNVVVRCELRLKLQLTRHEVIICDLYMSYPREWHLLVEIMTEPLSTNSIHTDERDVGTKEQTAVEHRLKGEDPTQRERHAPVGTELTEPAVSLVRIEVVREVSVLRPEVRTASGEHSLVLRVVMKVGMVTEEMTVADVEWKL